MIEFRLLGSLDLKGPEGTLRSVLAQPKRVALLAYLAVARPDGFHRRDKLLGLFWPESDQEHGRAALRKALYFLRQSLGEDVIVSRGDEEVGLAEDAVWCDAAAFGRALEGGKPEEALDLYRGDLLEGFFLSDAPEFERWLESERERLRGRASEAAWTLAEREEADRNGANAASWGKKAVNFSPDDESGFRRLLELLDRVGDRAGALKEYEAFARRLKEEYESEPSPETQALVASIREREVAAAGGSSQRPAVARAGEARAVAPEAVAVRPAPERDAEPRPVSLLRALTTYAVISLAVLVVVHIFTLQLGLPGWFFPSAAVVLLVCLPIIVATALVQNKAAAAKTAGAEVRPLSVAGRWLTWRSATASTVGALALWGVVSTGLLWMGSGVQRPAESLATDPANRIAVLPFAYHGSEEYSYLGETMDELLSAMLDGVGDLRTIPSRTVLATVGEEEGGGPGAEMGGRVATRLEAGRYVIGDVVEVGGRLRIDVRLHSSGGVRDAPVAATVEGDVGDFYNLVDSLTRQLLLDLVGSLQYHERLAVRTTDSLNALKIYLEGVAGLRAGRSRSAFAAFQQAVQIDSTFALAWFGMVGAAAWPGRMEYDAAVEAAERAERQSERLPPRARGLLRVWAAFMRGDALEAERLSRELLSRYPRDAETWYALALTLMNFGQFRGRQLSEGFEPAKRALRYNPTDRHFQNAGMWVAACENDWATFDSLSLVRYGDVESGLPFGWRAVRAFGAGDEAAQQKIFAEARERRAAGSGAAAVVWTLKDVPTAAELARLADRNDRDPELRALGHIGVAGFELAVGRWSAAQTRLARVASVRPYWAMFYRALWAASPSTPVADEELRALRDSIAAWDAGAVVPSVTSTRARAHDILAPQLRLYALGRLSWRLGEGEAALHHAAELEQLGNPPEALTYAIDRALSLRAHVLYDEGRLEEALAALESQPRRIRAQYLWDAAFYTHPEDRFLRGEIHSRLGRLEEALRWYAVIGDGFPFSDYHYMGLAYRRSAELHEQLGDVEGAVLEYARFIRLWQDCDPELRPMLDGARRAIQALSPDK